MSDDTDLIKEQFGHLREDVRRMATYFMGSHEFSDDILQDVFLELTAKGSGFKGKSSFKTYVFAITRNVAYRHIRGLSRRRELNRLAAAEQPRQVGSIIDRVALNSALGRMKAKYREPLLLKEMEGLSYNEIAEILRIRLGTVKFRISTAKKQLIRLLER